VPVIALLLSLPVSKCFLSKNMYIRYKYGVSDTSYSWPISATGSCAEEAELGATRAQ